MAPENFPADGYETAYQSFDSPLMRRLRGEAYGEDIGQHSWVGAEELREDVRRLNLSPSSRLVDLGCGACGPLTFVLTSVGCRGTGVELSAAALHAGRARADSLGVAGLLSVQQADLNAPLPFGPRSFDAAMSLDVVCHISDRGRLFREVARVLSPGGRFLFTDPCVVTGSLSSEEMRGRSIHGYTGFSAPGSNETLLNTAGLRLIETQDRSAAVLRNAGGRLRAMQTHRAELERIVGAARLEQESAYLEIAIALAQRGALSRLMYLAGADVSHGAGDASAS
jgi:SAM-dependent methyltransferase